MFYFTIDELTDLPHLHSTYSQYPYRPQTAKAATSIEIIKTPQNEARQILARQRLNRPVSPHLGIYKWQITSVLSALERITGIFFAGGLYIFGTAYAVTHYLGWPAGWDLSSASMAAAFGALPVAVKVAAKFCVAWPFAFHCFNGAKYLVWSTGRLLTNGQVIRTGWVTVGAATVSAVAVTILL